MKPGDAFHGIVVYSEQHGSRWDVADFLFNTHLLCNQQEDETSNLAGFLNCSLSG